MGYDDGKFELNFGKKDDWSEWYPANSSQSLSELVRRTVRQMLEEENQRKN